MNRRNSRFARRRRSKQSLGALRRVSRYIRYISQIDGVKEITLAPTTQKFVECDIGNKISPANPWIFVDKEKIETHLEFYNNESCFYPIRKDIAAFPKHAMLVGSFSCAANKPASFFICTTEEAEADVLYILEKQRLHIQERVQKMQARLPGPEWNTLGSETEIEAEWNVNTRQLFCVDVNAIILAKQKTEFVMVFTEDLPNGYMEMLPGRNSYQIVLRKRLDKGVQCAALLIHKGVQSNKGGSFTKSIQYCYKYPEIEETETLALSLMDFLQVYIQDICNKLADNIHMNMETKDYQTLLNYPHIKILQQPVEIKIYQDVTYCTGRKISCLAWNALTSGIVVAAYVKNPLFQVLKKSQIQTTVEDPTEERNFALVWDYKNNVIPRLYLHARAEISSISFCPYNKFILVAGYTTGQIAIWDLRENFNIDKPQKYRTIREQNNHLEMGLLTSWIKKPLGRKHIFPTITSNVEVSHKSPVTSISWVPPSAFLEEDDQTKDYKMKFVTSELDGDIIYVWRLDPDQEENSKSVAVKSRIHDRPEALNRGLSKYKKLQANFAPLCKYYLNALVAPKNNPMLKILLHNKVYSYLIKNPSTLSDLNAESNFSVVGLKHSSEGEQKILYTTAFGLLQRTSCVSPTNETGNSVDICKVETLEPIHDGPILVCEANMFFPNVLLTVGGSVFGFWDSSQLQGALLWRKCRHRYLSGMWCFHRPLSVILLRNDRQFEYWNICETSKIPIKIFKYKGYEPVCFYGDADRSHVRKKTFITTDNVGAFKVMLLPSETLEQNEKHMVEARDFLKRIVDVVNYRELLKIKCKKIQTDVVVEVAAVEEQAVKEVKVIEKSPEPPKVKPTKAYIFQKKLLRYGMSVLLGLKGLDKSSIEPLKATLARNTQQEDDLTKFNLERKRVRTDKIVRSTKDLIQTLIPRSNSTRREITSTITKELVNDMKKQFFEDYTNLENNLKSHFKSIHPQPVPNVQKEASKMSYVKIITPRKSLKERKSSDTPRKLSVGFSKEITTVDSVQNITVIKAESIASIGSRPKTQVQ